MSIKNIPNILSISRIIMSVALFAVNGNTVLLLLLLSLIGLTDILDGYIARKYNAESPLGARLDSLGDFIFLPQSFFILRCSILE
ncbi:CDP-alcohol phosphatidyltransferase family protein [Brucepastera parasyntrophica]|uniref:CDP-alcohol phosphatidyltransferase family protein n=1 Tax=Brucepastera parasyntrophica TaxID=2880008 RepID=UPI0034E3036B|nr:CDP-alcohol phosphatidyltransferase family protein [Brucepastera parasyntrophica]